MRPIASLGRGRVRSPIATKLILSFLLVIMIISVAFMAAGVQLIRNRIIAETQDRVRHDLNAAREIYLSELRHISDVTRFVADRTLLFHQLLSGNAQYAATELRNVMQREGFDILALTDAEGTVLLRTSNSGHVGDDQSHDDLVATVLRTEQPVASSVIISAEDLEMESHLLAARAYMEFIDTPMARERPESEETAGLMLKAAAPIFGSQGQLIGVVYGGVLLNRDFQIVDEVKQTVFENVTYKGQDIGTATIFQDDVRISTNVKNEDGSRAIGTRVSEEVYERVVREGEPWVDRAYVVNNWYITAYEPIRKINNGVIGILYVGILEQKYVDIQKETIFVFLAITLLGTFASMGLAYFVARRISVPIDRLVSASREVARGNLDTKVDIVTSDELGELAGTFNVMASALKERDERLKEFATRKIEESERLALIGQLAANVAHEVNNPLQGIVTYSHLLLERVDVKDSTREFIERIVAQADRCRDIIRGLLDFSRQRKPDKTVCNVNTVLQGCVALVQDQALFHNIEIERHLDANLPMAIIDPSQIERVFMNLIINAAEAMTDGGRLILTTRCHSNDGSIDVIIQDTGPGIPEEFQSKLFEPFFTTKDPGHGTGLGLAISYGIVKEHRGSISVESEAGVGTTFIVSLPLTTEEED